MKRNPISRKVSPSAVSQIGTTGNRISSKQIYVGKGRGAPAGKSQIHPRGSQRG